MRTDRCSHPRGRPSHRLILTVLLALAVSACGGPERVDWSGARFTLPEGWSVVTEERDRLVVADHDVIEQEQGVLVTFVRVPGTLPDDWRRRVEERGALLESDSGILIAGDVPATQLVLLDEMDGTPFREVLLVVASRGLVISVAPRVPPGDRSGPRVLLDGLDAVRDLLDVIDLAPPAFS